jgi:RNA polymerase sigma factor (sigma-70 family)
MRRIKNKKSVLVLKKKTDLNLIEENDQRLSIYLKGFRKYDKKRNDKDEIRELIRKAQTGDIESRNEIIERNIGLIIHIAKVYTQNVDDFFESLQEGVFGIIKAVEKFNLKYPFKFSTYASWWIAQAITRNQLNQPNPVRIPIVMLGTRGKAVKKLRTKNERVNYDKLKKMIKEELETTELTADFVSRQILFPNNTQDDFILDDSLKYSKKNLEAFKRLRRNDLKVIIDMILTNLTEREREVIRRRFGIERKAQTLREIGNEMSLSRERIRQIEKEGLNKLKDFDTTKELKEKYEKGEI